LSTPDNYARGIVSGLRELIEELSLSPSHIDRLLHATTVATNSILEGKGSRTALITTKGFRDVLELRRIRIPRLYDLFFEKPAPLVPRRYRFEVEERVDARGKVLVPLNEDEVRTAISKIGAAQIDSVAVCFLNSYTEPAHERRVSELVHGRLPNIYLSLSADVLPEIREYERTSTTVINACIGPLVKNYLQQLEEQLATIRVKCPLLIMQSSGG
jgi:N-methylhydantoinase A